MKLFNVFLDHVTDLGVTSYRPAPLLEPTHSQYLKQSQLNSIRGFLQWNDKFIMSVMGTTQAKRIQE